jgi:hypothetical protein
VLHKLRELRLWPGSLWAALSESPSKYATEQPGTFTCPSPTSPFPPAQTVSLTCTATTAGAGAGIQTAIDTSLTPSELIADAVKRSSRGHVFHFYTLLCEIASVPRKAPNAWIAADRVGATSKEKQENGGGRMSAHAPTGAGSGVDHGHHVLSFDARVLARECLKEVGRELGVLR